MKVKVKSPIFEVYRFNPDGKKLDEKDFEEYKCLRKINEEERGLLLIRWGRKYDPDSVAAIIGTQRSLVLPDTYVFLEEGKVVNICKEEEFNKFYEVIE